MPLDDMGLLKFYMEKSFCRVLVREFRNHSLLWPEGLGAVDHRHRHPELRIPWLRGLPVQESVVSGFVRGCIDAQVSRWKPNDDYTAGKVKDVANHLVIGDL